MEKSLFRSVGRHSLAVALSALALGGCANVDDATTASSIEVAASPDTVARSTITRWTVARHDAVLVIDGLDARGVTREHDELALTNGRPDAISRAWFDEAGRALGTVTTAPGAEPVENAPAGVCARCVSDTEEATARLLRPRDGTTGTSAQALTYSPAALPLEDGPLLPAPGGGVIGTSPGGDFTSNVEVTHNDCWSCGGTSVTVCDYRVLGVCLWSHFECRASGPASAQCLRDRAALQL